MRVMMSEQPPRVGSARAKVSIITPPLCRFVGWSPYSLSPFAIAHARILPHAASAAVPANTRHGNAAFSDSPSTPAAARQCTHHNTPVVCGVALQVRLLDMLQEERRVPAVLLGVSMVVVVALGLLVESLRHQQSANTHTTSGRSTQAGRTRVSVQRTFLIACCSRFHTRFHRDCRARHSACNLIA